MDHYRGAFRMESAGSLTPDLEGAARSAVHPRTSKEKGRTGHEVRRETAPALSSGEGRKTR